MFLLRLPAICIGESRCRDTLQPELVKEKGKVKQDEPDAWAEKEA